MDVGVDVVNAVVGRDVSSRQSDRFRGENFWCVLTKVLSDSN